MKNKTLDMLQRIAGGAIPFAFTEQGISMLSVVLKKFSISCLMLIICGGLG